MKKSGLFKIIMFTLLGMIVASWFISATYFENETLSELGMNYAGLFDAFSMFFKSFLIEYFVQVLLLLLSIAGLYGVLEATGLYRKLVNKIVDDLKGREFLFLVLVSLFIAILTSVFDFGFALFIFFPLIISVLLLMGYDKVTVGLATFGSMLIGIIGNTVGYNTSGIVASVLNVETANNFYFKLALLLVSYVVLLLFLSKQKRHKVEEKDLKNDDLFMDEVTPKKESLAPIVIVLCVLFVLLVLGCTNWEDTFKVTFFTDLHDKLFNWEPKLPYLHLTTEGFKVGTEKIAILNNLFGDLGAFGKWYYSEMTVLCFLSSLLLGLIYRVNAFEGFGKGIKKMLKPVGVLFMSYVVLYVAANLMIYPTIADLLLGLTNKLRVLPTALVMAIASFLHVDVLFVANYAAPQIALKATNTSLVALLTQSIYGVVMFIAPTSIYLAFGLPYLGISYKEWVKKTWKLVLALLVVVLVVLLIANYL